MECIRLAAFKSALLLGLVLLCSCRSTAITRNADEGRSLAELNSSASSGEETPDFDLPAAGPDHSEIAGLFGAGHTAGPVAQQTLEVPPFDFRLDDNGKVHPVATALGQSGHTAIELTTLEEVSGPAFDSVLVPEPEPEPESAADPPAAAAPVIQPVTLQFAQSMALENNPDIAVLGMTPDIAHTAIAAETGLFDPVFSVDVGGGKYDRQVTDLVQTLGFPSTTQQSDLLAPRRGLNMVALTQKVSTGGTAQIGYGTNYLLRDPVGIFAAVNPYWNSGLNLSFEQPLFKGRGKEVTYAPIRIAQANHRQAYDDFQSRVQIIVRDTELAYWDLVLTHEQTRALKAALERMQRTVEMERERLRLGEGTLGDVVQTEKELERRRVEYAESKQRQIAARSTLLQQMGLPADDNRVLVPEFQWNEDPLAIDWDHSLTTALSRPMLSSRVAAVDAARINLMRRRNDLKPDVSIRFNYALTGVDDRLDDSFQTVTDNQFNDWTVWLMYERPLGMRTARANAERAELQLSQNLAQQYRTEYAIRHQLTLAYRNLMARYDLLETHRTRVETTKKYLEIRMELYRNRKAVLRDVLDAHQSVVEAEMASIQARARYQQAVTAWHYATGDLWCLRVSAESL